MDAVKYFKERERMLKSLGKTSGQCNGIPCFECPFHAQNGGCVLKELESVEIVEKWSAENPQKTILMDLLEKYPNVQLNDYGCPSFCPFLLGYAPNESCMKMDCKMKKKLSISQIENICIMLYLSPFIFIFFGLYYVLMKG